MLLELLLVYLCSAYIAVFGFKNIYVVDQSITVVDATICSILTSSGFCESTEPSIHISSPYARSLLFVASYYVWTVTYGNVYNACFFFFFSHFKNMTPSLLLGVELPNSSTPYIFQFQAVCLLYICSGLFCLSWVQNLVISLCTIRGKLLSLYTTRCCWTSAFTADVFCILKRGRIYDFPHVLLSPIIKLIYPKLLSNPNYINVIKCCYVYLSSKNRVHDDLKNFTLEERIFKDKNM